MTAPSQAIAVIQSGGRTLSHDTMLENASRAANGLASLGIGKGDTIAICLRNDFAYFEATFAAGLLGVYPVPVNWHATVAEARYAFEDSGASAILVHADLLARLGESIPADVPVFVVPTPPEIQAAYDIPEEACGVQTGQTAWQDWLATQAPYQGDPAPAPGTMIYTSGTTGRPKGVRRFPPSPEQTQASFRRLTGVFGLVNRDGGGIITVVTGPMYHSSPNTHAMISVRQGGHVILQPRFDAAELLALIERHGVTHLHLVPIMLNRLLRLPEETKRRYNISSLKYVIHTAAPVSPPVKRAMIEWWGPIIHEYYGTSETSILTHCPAQDWLAHPGSVGKPLPDSEIRVIDEAGGGACGR